MTSARVRAFLIAAALAAAIILVIVARPGSAELGSRSAGERPRLLLLTSLPLAFGDQFSLQQAGSSVLTKLESRYRVVPISVASPQELRKGGLLLMAHPLAQPAEDLVALDDWVRAGGRVLLLADPLLEGMSERPLGDPLRPPPMFSDTGLLRHWGLRLQAPAQRGPKLLRLGGYEVLTGSPGTLSGGCAISPDALVAQCAIGRGQVTVVADADFLDTKALDGPTQHNLDALLEELAALERR